MPRQQQARRRTARGTLALCYWVALAAALVSGGSSVASGQDPVPALQWFRGNTHAHTDRSDGNAPPLEVAQWYRDLGYDFVVITDHDQVTPVAPMQDRQGANGDFLIIGGEEISASHEGRAVHINGLGLDTDIVPRGGSEVADVISANIAAVANAGGVAQLNHPNYGWFMNAAMLAQVPNLTHMEILNPHPVNNSAGGGGRPSAEGLWDELLTRGRRIYAIAADDAHDYDSFVPAVTQRGPSLNANPGHAWIVVRARQLTAAHILEAIADGDYYCSTGVELRAYAATASGVRMQLHPDYRYRVDVPGELRYRTYFIGGGGRTLAIDETLAPTYSFRGDEGYVRARIEASDGTIAWTQPLFVEDTESDR